LHLLVLAFFPRRFVQMSSERGCCREQIIEAGLRDDSLAHGTDYLAQQTPQPGSGQTADAERGESSSASTDGSSNSSISKWARI
jgi:hypothetical protein